MNLKKVFNYILTSVTLFFFVMGGPSIAHNQELYSANELFITQDVLENQDNWGHPVTTGQGLVDEQIITRSDLRSCKTYDPWWPYPYEDKFDSLHADWQIPFLNPKADEKDYISWQTVIDQQITQENLNF